MKGRIQTTVEVEGKIYATYSDTFVLPGPHGGEVSPSLVEKLIDMQEWIVTGIANDGLRNWRMSKDELDVRL